MKASNQNKTRHRPSRFPAKLDLRIELSEEEILADLRYPARERPVRRVA